MGVSSAGKSTYIQYVETNPNNEKWENPLHVLAGHNIFDTDLSNLDDDKQYIIVHYNMFRPFKNNIRNIDNPLLPEKLLIDLLNCNGRLTADILVASKHVIAKRALLRTKPDNRYPYKNIFNLLCNIDLAKLYLDYLQVLDEKGIPYEIFDSTDPKYRKLKGYNELLEVVNQDSTTYSRDEIDFIVKRHGFEGESKQLQNDITPHNNCGEDLLDIVLERNLSDKSILEIGCDYGHFCFEVEKRNASSVVGIEPKEHRYIACNIVKEILSSRVQFINDDAFGRDDLDGQFDIVFMFDVLHFLSDPIQALKKLLNFVERS